jgi:hypothetical protein
LRNRVILLGLLSLATPLWAANLTLAVAGGQTWGVNSVEHRVWNGQSANKYDSVLTTPSDGQRYEAWTSQVDVVQGKIRLTNTGYVIGAATDHLDFFTNVYGLIGDTVNIFERGNGVGQLTSRIKITGSFLENEGLQGGYVDNYSYLQIFVMKPGNFDNPSSANVLFTRKYGIGPNPQLLGGTPFDEIYETLPAFIDFPFPLAALEDGFQISILAQVIAGGRGPGVGWQYDLGNTFEVALLAPSDVRIGTVGGSPVGVLDTAAVPEPGTFAIAFAGFVGLAAARWRKRSQH